MEMECEPERESGPEFTQNDDVSGDMADAVEAMDSGNNDTSLDSAVKCNSGLRSTDHESGEDNVNVNVPVPTQLINPVKTRSEQGVQCSGLRDGDFKVPTSTGGRRQMHACNSCDRIFSTKRDLVTHQYMHRENTKFKSCSECNKMFTTETAYIRHMKSHNRKPVGRKGKAVKKRKVFTCNQCNQVFDTKRKLTTHHQDNHVDQKKFACEICGSQFAWAENLRAHKLMHEVNPHECTKCGRGFVDATSLRVHTRNSHGPNSVPAVPRKVFSCDICGRAYQFDFSLRAHMKGHTQPTANAPERQNLSDGSSVVQHHYVHVSQEGSIDLGDMAGSQGNANEIIIEVYNYGTPAENGNNETGMLDQTIQSHEQEKVEKIDVSAQSVETMGNTNQYLDHFKETSHSDVMENLFSEAFNDSSCVTNDRNPVSIDESGMCITVSAEALPKLLDMEVGKQSEADMNTNNVADLRKMAGFYGVEHAVQQEVAKPGVQYTNATGLGNTELVWYAPPPENDDDNAMIVWYQPPQSADSFKELSGGSFAESARTEWNQNVNDMSSSVDGSTAKCASNHESEKTTLLLDQVIAFESKNDNITDSDPVSLRTKQPPPLQKMVYPCMQGDDKLGQNGHASMLPGGRRGRKTRPREPFLFNIVMTDEKPFVCFVCGEAFRWEISLNVHMRVHNESKVVRGQARGSRVKVKMNLPSKQKNSVKSDSSVGRSRIVPRTASSSEDDDGDEFRFRTQPDDETSPQQLRFNQSKGLDSGEAKIRTNGRGSARGLCVRGFGPRMRGASTRLRTINKVDNSTIGKDVNSSASIFEGGKCSISVSSTTPVKVGFSDALFGPGNLNGNSTHTSSSETVLLAQSDEILQLSRSQVSGTGCDVTDNEHVNVDDGQVIMENNTIVGLTVNAHEGSLGMLPSLSYSFTLPTAGSYKGTICGSDVVETPTTMSNETKSDIKNNELHLDRAKKLSKSSSKVSTGPSSRRVLHMCSSCSSTFSNKKALALHRNMHVEAVQLSCIECSKTFKTKTTYLRHVRSHTSTETASIIIPEALVQDHETSLTSRLIYAANAASAIVSLPSGTSSFSCSVGFELANVGNKWLACQRSTHLVCSFCLVCKRLLTTLRAACQHRRRHLLAKSLRLHQISRCNACSISFSCHSDLLFHQKMCSRIKGCRCRLCRRVFTSKSQLLRHVRKHASVVRPSSCEHCSKRFFDVNQCKIHESACRLMN